MRGAPYSQFSMRSATHLPRFPTPVAAKSRTLPAHHPHDRAKRALIRQMSMALRTDGNQRYNWMKNRRIANAVACGVGGKLVLTSPLPGRQGGFEARFFMRAESTSGPS